MPKVNGSFNLIEDKSLFSFSITSFKVRPIFALLFEFAKLIAVSSINPCDSSLKSISIIGRWVSIFSINNCKLVVVNWPLPDILSCSKPFVFNDLRVEVFDISLVLRKWLGSEIELSESWIILTSDKAFIGNEFDDNKIIAVNKKVKKSLMFFSLVYTS